MCTDKPHSVREGCSQLRDVTWLEQPNLALTSGALRIPFASGQAILLAGLHIVLLGADNLPGVVASHHRRDRRVPFVKSVRHLAV